MTNLNITLTDGFELSDQDVLPPSNNSSRDDFAKR